MADLYARKALTVEAVRWRGSNREEIDAFLLPEGGWPMGQPLMLQTEGGPRAVPVGHWIVRDPVHGLYAQDALAFSLGFDLVAPAPAPTPAPEPVPTQD
jgi:hypothetical protein